MFLSKTNSDMGRLPARVQSAATGSRAYAGKKSLRLKKRIGLLILACVLIAAIGFMRVRYESRMESPLRTKLDLSANFGELRPGHFHMGIDIRTNGRENMPVYATAKGYVSRVLIDPYGYGRALFIAHPDGRTTLYAHLNRFYDKVEQLVNGAQYANRSWQIDSVLPAGKFPVNKGQLIAWSGNTGRSEGPHLHFELRDTRTGNNLNPANHGFRVSDHTPPVIQGLYWYDRRYSTYEAGPTRIAISGKGGQYQSQRKVVKVTSPLISFGIRAEDKLDGSRFRYGIYRMRIWMDDVLVNGFTLDNFSSADSRYINACVDYAYYRRTGLYIQHLSKLPGNQLPIFEGGNGLIHLKDSLPHNVRIEVTDVLGNRATLRFALQRGHYDPVVHKYARGANLLLPGRTQVVRSKNAEIRFSKNAFYDTVSFLLHEKTSTNARAASPLISLHKSFVPVHEAFEVKIKPVSGLRRRLRERIVMQFSGGESKLTVMGHWQNGWVCGTFDELGTVQLIVDTVKPEIMPVGWDDGATIGANKKSLQFRCGDDMGTIVALGAELDGQWILVRHEGQLFTYHFDERCKPGRHRLTVRATDAAGNTTVSHFAFRKE